MSAKFGLLLNKSCVVGSNLNDPTDANRNVTNDDKQSDLALNLSNTKQLNTADKTRRQQRFKMLRKRHATLKHRRARSQKKNRCASRTCSAAAAVAIAV